MGNVNDEIEFKQVQRKTINFIRTVCEENGKIFVVHGRNIAIRDRVTSLLGRLKLDYVVLESEHNSGETVIEKFLRNAKECKYAIVLFSADDEGRLKTDEHHYRNRPRQNVILELGFFLSQVGRKNICILHEVIKDLEKPSDFSGIVYEPFDEYGAWKGKLMKEMKKAGLYIDPKLAERV